MPFKNPQDRKKWKREWARQNPESVRTSNRKQYYKDPQAYSDRQTCRVYGITQAQLDEIRERYPVCAICGKQASGKRHCARLFIDHCHATGKIRGMLCVKCNHGIGHFDDRPELLEAAIQYLRRNR